MKYSFDIPRFLEWVLQTWAPAGRMAARAAYSRSHFSRLFANGVGETPRVLRRRLQLEAAAHLLTRTGFTVGEVAVEVGYATPEAFAKAFKSAYGVAPRQFRADGAVSHRLETKSGIHFHPSGLIVRRQGVTTMTLTEMLFRHHIDEVAMILETADSLADQQLDAESITGTNPIPFDRPAPTLRTLLERLVVTQELWLAAFKGNEYDWPQSPMAIADLRRRHETSGPTLVAFAKEVEDEGLMVSEFVDALCEPPERFQFGAVLAHVLTFSAHRRQLAIAALREMGNDIGYGDPIAWSRGEKFDTAGC